jgi:hypothetical protein
VSEPLPPPAGKTSLSKKSETLMSLVDLSPPIPQQTPRAPVWSFRRPGRSPLFRVFAHLIVRLLIVTPLPEPLQVAAALFPVWVLWPLVRPAEGGIHKTEDAASTEEAAESRSSRSLGARWVGAARGTRGELFVNVTNPRQPVLLGAVRLSQTIGDIVIHDKTALVSAAAYTSNAGTASLVSLADPSHPVLAGTPKGVGSRVAMGSGKLADMVFSSVP